MKRDYKLYLEDIRESIQAIEEYIKNLSEENFKNNKQIKDAIIRRLEIIGEAISNLPRSLKVKNPSEIWGEFGEFRNYVVHHYFEASLSRIWRIVTKDIPKLKKVIENINLV